MKKVYVLLLVALLVLVGCSNDETAKDEIVSILGKDQLVMATSADYPPYEFIQEVNGKQKIVGFDIFMAEYIAEQWGVDLVIQDVKFEALLTGLETGMYDMVIAGMTPSPERKANFSDIYYNATHGVVIRKDSIDEIKTKEDLDGKHIGAQLGSIQE
ncbi:MAG: transporter substrate-binding domain-containing protein, partial [Tissierellia bacterium]|nr:transporter substrate-binding domain-containing protein [Tissierellia bacterium]